MKLFNLKTYFAGSILILFYITEFISKIGFYANSPNSIQLFTKISVALYFLMEMTVSLKKRKSIIIGFLTLTAGFILGQNFLIGGFTMYSIKIFGKYIFALLVLQYFYFNPLSKKAKSFLIQAFKLLIIVNAMFIILGLIFDIHVFETYKYGRFGYNGLLRNSSTSSYFYLIAVFYVLFKRNLPLRYDSLFVIVMISSLLIGTKSVYLSILFFGFFKVYKMCISTKARVLLISLVSLIGLGLFYIVFYNYTSFTTIQEEKGILSSILSFRNDLFINRTLPHITNHWSFIHYLFGGVDDPYVRSQLDLIDVLHFFGLVGTILYIYMYYKLLVTFTLNYKAVALLFFLSFIIMLSGNFLSNPTVVMYIVFVQQILKTSDTTSFETRII
ncbi:hypothetical protein GCM10009117_19150 [Gangjinia marincola]|uniref:Uncharacterized protein n=1 Tax=Gangjinia marincola TaxID=578463 RepID=A0ABN1MHZ2_9FLAO